jgi:hypothetical protein
MTDGPNGGAQKDRTLRPRCVREVDPETATHIYPMWTGREAAHHQQPSAKMDKLTVTSLCVLLLSGTDVLPHSVGKGDVRYSRALK